MCSHMTNLIENNGNGIHVDLVELKRLYATSETAKKILNYFAGRKNNKNETTVDRLHGVLVAEGHEVTRGQLIDALRQLAELGCGEFKTGRKGWPTRMVWSVGIVSLGQVASGQATAVQEIDDVSTDEEEVPVAAKAVEHDQMNVSYPLRPELMVGLSLPKNLTQKEANRLADFIKTLPFGDERSEVA